MKVLENIHGEGVWVAQWLMHGPITNTARVQFLLSAREIVCEVAKADKWVFSWNSNSAHLSVRTKCWVI